ncbi:MAG: tyrosine-type recombinase/integrase [Fuerstiella sp.]|nr:tyrosine-type recombinase/integrase [Fuerstiella sp.]
MARKPVYGLHSTSGQARTTVNGKRISLGKYGSPESKAKFDEVMAQWEADHAERNPAVQVSLTVSRLALLFMKHAIEEYVDVDGEPTGEADNFKYALRSLTNYFHGVRVIDFGPKKLKELRDRLVDEGLAQGTINSRIRRIKQVIEWGVSEEYVSVNHFQALRTVKGLRAGRTKAKPPTPKPKVEIEHVEAVQRHVTSPVWGLIQFMLLTGCRPSEACALRWSKIDTSGQNWVYQPQKHKTSHRGKNRSVIIGPRCQKLLNSFREHSRSDYVFDPQVGLEEFVRKEYGDQAKSRKVGEFYTKDSLYTAIQKACDKAEIPRWSPGQLRKTRATQARQQADLETAQQILGHSSKTTTERSYAEMDLSRGQENALKFG